MIHQAKGFSLIECLIYGAIASFISMLAFAFFSRTINGVHLFAAHQQRLLSSWSAQQLLRRDIQMASSQLTDWHINDSELVCRVNDDCIGWHVNNTNLYRTKGSYNFSLHRWSRKNSALVAKGVTNFKITSVTNQEFITSISCNVTIGKITLFKTIHLTNGMQETV